MQRLTFLTKSLVEELLFKKKKKETIIVHTQDFLFFLC